MGKGKLIVVSGFSGAGKGTLMNELMARYDNYVLSVSATTRAPRPGEIEGVSYFYKTDEEFRQMIERDELIEYAGYVGHYYGTPKTFVEDNLEAGKDVFLEIEIQGAMKIKQKYQSEMTVMIKAKGVSGGRTYRRMDDMTFEIDIRDEDEIPKLVREIVEAGGEVYQVSAKLPSLEDIYFTLTAHEQIAKG